MLTIKPVISRDKKRKDGTYNIKLQFTLNRKVKRISTSLSVTEEDLTKNFTIKEGTALKYKVDSLIASYQDRCLDLRVDLNSYSLQEILLLLRKEEERQKPIDFIAFSRKWIEETPVKGKKNYQSALNAFVSFLGKDSLEASKLTSTLLNSFMNHLKKKHEQKVISQRRQGKRVTSNRMVSLYMGGLRHLFYEAKKYYNAYDEDIIRIPNSPFEHVNIPKQEVTRKRALSVQQIRSICAYPYNTTRKGTLIEGNLANLAKDCFILSFCLIGMNSVDLYNCSEISDNTITYYRTKTRDRRLDDAKMEVQVHPCLRTLINKYKDPTRKKVFRFYKMYSTPSGFNKAINKGLKEIGKELNIEDLEFYAARHSWATIAINKVGINKYIVHEALNHLDDSMKVTDIYIERDFSQENEANRKVIEYVFKKENLPIFTDWEENSNL